MTTLGIGAIWYGRNRETIHKRGLLEALFDPGSGRTVGRRGGARTKKLLKGSISCPIEEGRVPPSTAQLTVGDFVVLKLLDAKDKFVESTWAQVRAISPDRELLKVQLVGELTPEGQRDLKSDRHGFRLNDIITVTAECVSEVLHHHAVLRGVVVCGPQVESLGFSLKDSRGVSKSSDVQIVVADKKAPKDVWEKLWVHVTHVLPTSNVIHGVVADDPQLSTKHGLRKFSKVEFTRDCIVNVRGAS